MRKLVNLTLSLMKQYSHKLVYVEETNEHYAGIELDGKRFISYSEWSCFGPVWVKQQELSRLRLILHRKVIKTIKRLKCDKAIQELNSINQKMLQDKPESVCMMDEPH